MCITRTREARGEGASRRSIWISDVHLGTRHAQVGALLEFLRRSRSDHLYIVGDLIDGSRDGAPCFYDRPGIPEVEQASPNLTFHRLDGGKFLRMMAGCRAVVTTAGFESIGEAAWLGKPVYLVPVEDHAEQQWNARDAVQAGLGIAGARFDLDRLKSLPRAPETRQYRAWVSSAEEALGRVIELSGEQRNGGRGCVTFVNNGSRRQSYGGA